jgi:hypothetical protein
MQEYWKLGFKGLSSNLCEAFRRPKAAAAVRRKASLRI